MIFTDITNWAMVEAELREQDFKRAELLVVRELWFRLQPENLVKELSLEQLEDVLGIVAEAYDKAE